MSKIVINFIYIIYALFVAWMLFLQSSYLSDILDKKPDPIDLYLSSREGD